LIDATTTLHAAAQTGHLDVVKLFLANKADKNARSHKGVTPLEVAQRNHHSDQWFPSISDIGPKAISREVCGATSEIF